MEVMVLETGQNIEELGLDVRLGVGGESVRRRDEHHPLDETSHQRDVVLHLRDYSRSGQGQTVTQGAFGEKDVFVLQELSAKCSPGSPGVALGLTTPS